MRLQGNVRKRLQDVREETGRLRESLAILEEQLTYVAGVAADAELAAVVASTPLADRDWRIANEDLRRLRRERDDVARRVAELEAEQDRLLDKLLEELA
jgi:chromosome segregation ATPase